MKPGPEVSICAVWQAKEYKKRTQKICATSTTIPGGEALYNPKSQAVILPQFVLPLLSLGLGMSLGLSIKRTLGVIF